MPLDPGFKFKICLLNIFRNFRRNEGRPTNMGKIDPSDRSNIGQASLFDRKIIEGKDPQQFFPYSWNEWLTSFLLVRLGLRLGH